MRIKSKYLIAPLLLLLLAFHVDKRIIRGRWYTSPDERQLAYETEYHGHQGEPRDVFIFSFDFGVRYFPYVQGIWQWSPDSQYVLTEYCSLLGGCAGDIVRLKNKEVACRFYYLSYGPLQNHPCNLIELTDGELWLMSSHRRYLRNGLTVQQILDGAYIFTYAFPWSANSLLVVIHPTLILVDTPHKPQATQEIIEWAERLFGTRNIVAINTGYHYENLGGNAYLLEQGIPIYGSDLTVQLLAERGDAMRAMTLERLHDPKDKAYCDAYSAMPLVAPDHVFPLKEGLRLKFGDEIVEIYYPGPSRAPDNVVVYFPARKLLYAGSVVIGEDSIGDNTEADMAAWPDAVRALSRFDAKVVIPGSGERLTPRLLEHTLELLNEQ